MKKRFFRYLKHITLTFIILGICGILFGLYHGASLRYSENPIMMNWDKEGPYVFYKNDSILTLNYIRGNQKSGFFLEQQEHKNTSEIAARCFFPLDSTSFDFTIRSTFETPAVSYNDNHPILAISDIESGFKTFRDFLIVNKVIDRGLNWTFGRGHLVLLGDFVDRGESATQVLWLIYKLEQEAKQKGGIVHFILGNHELKNMQGNFESTSPKYFHVSAILQKQPQELYSLDSFLGRWLNSKNSIEQINGVLFTHGGLHPDLKKHAISLAEINQIVRKNYYKPYYPKAEKNLEQLLISSHDGISWYRGYFKEDLTQEDVESSLNKLGAKAIVVGHTLQAKINRQYKGKIVGIDVKHPKDYSKSFPNQQSEGLLIENNKFYRILHDGEKKEI